MAKAALGFRIYKISQILKRFAGIFCRAQTLKLRGMYCEEKKSLPNHDNGEIKQIPGIP